VRNADIVVQQKFDAPDIIPEEAFAGSTPRRVRFPYLSGRLYWPYSGVAHIRAESAPANPPFPYVAELGDSLLNQMIQEQVPAADALARYDATVAASFPRIRRLAELHLERQRDRDAVCGMDFASTIAAEYRQEALFTTQGHPGMKLSRMLVERVFLAMGAPYSLVDATVRSLRVSPFPRPELPFHPGVAEALGLRFVMPEQRYPFQNEGAFTFAEYALRYLAGAWEPELTRGLTQMQNGAVEGPVRLVQAALRRCEGSSVAWRLLGSALLRLGRLEATQDALEMAVARDPEDPDGYVALSHLLSRQGKVAEAEAMAQQAVRIFPFGATGHRALADVLGRQGRLTEAVAVARVGVAADPGDAKGLLILAHHLQRAGELPEAERVLRQAVEAEPDNANFRRQHAELTERIARADAKAA
jgi:Flp pilus assembly protein TadD